MEFFLPLALFVGVCAEMMDFCVIGDSTLHMFIVPAWHNFCSRNKNVPCGFSIVEQGVFYQYDYSDRHYNRTTLIGKSSDGACTFMLAECHGLYWLGKIQSFWKPRGGVACKRLLTNYHHHAKEYLAGQRTLSSISRFARETRRTINASIPFTEFVYILPTFPLSTTGEFPQTRIGVLETSAAISSLVETISTIHDLSEMWRERGAYGDNLHVGRSNVERDVFTMEVVKSMLTREFDLCRRRRQHKID